MIRASLFVLVLLTAGCCCPSAATLAHIDTQAAAHDGAARLIEASVAGKLTGDQAADNVTADQLAATPAPVRKLLRRSLRFVYESRESWHTLRFSMGNGPDPETLSLSQPPSLGTGDALGD